MWTFSNNTVQCKQLQKMHQQLREVMKDYEKANETIKQLQLELGSLKQSQ